jgi:Microtubule binding
MATHLNRRVSTASGKVRISKVVAKVAVCMCNQADSGEVEGIASFTALCSMWSTHVSVLRVRGLEQTATTCWAFCTVHTVQPRNPLAIHLQHFPIAAQLRRSQIMVTKRLRSSPHHAPITPSPPPPPPPLPPAPPPQLLPLPPPQTLRAQGGDVRVVCRVRPANAKELALGSGRCVNTPAHDRIEAVAGDRRPETFTFDRVFDEASSQADVFENVARPIVVRSATQWERTGTFSLSMVFIS